MIQSKWKIPNRDLGYANRDYNEMVQLALKLDNEKNFRIVLNNFKKMFMGLRVCTDGEYLMHSNNDFKVHSLPSNITTCQDASDYIYKYHSPDWKERIAEIGVANNNIVVVNSNHICSDGGFVLYALKHCLDNDLGIMPEFPWRVKEAFEDEFKKISINNPKLVTKEEMTQFDLDQNFKSNDQVDIAESVIRVIDARSVKCYDSQRNKMMGLNDFISSMFSLALMANSCEKNKFGLHVCIDYRKFLKPSQLNLSCCNHFICTKINAPGISMNNTIADLNKSFKTTLNEKITTGAIYSAYNQPWEVPYPQGAFGCLSNLGPISVKPPIEDFWIQSSMNKYTLHGNMLFVTYSKLIGNRNDLVFKLTYDQDSVPTKVGKALNDSIVYALQNISPNTKISDALKKIKQFQDYHNY